MEEVVEQAAHALANALAEVGAARCKAVLQFSDETLRHAVATSEQMQSCMAKRLQERQHACELDVFVLADSNYGNVGADDISAMHVSSPEDGPTVLVRFGRVDLTTKGALPIMLVCAAKKIPDLAGAADKLAGRLAALQSEADSSDSRVWLVYEAAFADDCASLAEQLRSRSIACECGRLPATADLSRWSLNPEPEAKPTHRMAGLEFDAAPGDTDVLVYVGSSDSQLLSLNMQHPQQRIVHFDPEADSWTTGTGADIRAYKQRAFAIQKAKDAEIVGLLLGSMGLETQVTQQVLAILRQQCVAAGKKVYTFTMGKINEAKLSNFGEVDVYCLISNAESSVIDPRAFHVPLVTPVELQIALGVREWQTSLETDLRAVVEAAGDVEDQTDALALLEASEDNQVVRFESAAALRFAERSFQGLVPTVHKAITGGAFEDEDDGVEGGAVTVSYEIQQGQVGIASSYHAAGEADSSSMR